MDANKLCANCQANFYVNSRDAKTRALDFPSKVRRASLAVGSYQRIHFVSMPRVNQIKPNDKALTQNLQNKLEEAENMFAARRKRELLTSHRITAYLMGCLVNTLSA